MNLIKTMLVQSWHAPYSRAALIAVIASALLLTGLVGVGLPYVSGDDKNLIKVDSTVVTKLSPAMRTDTVDGHLVRHINGTHTYTGEGLNGVATLQRVILLETPLGCEGCRWWSRQILYCTGCVDGHTGTLFYSFYFDGQYLAGGVASWTGTWEVIKGTGDLAGARGGGDSVGETIAGVTTSTITGKIHFEGIGP